MPRRHHREPAPAGLDEERLRGGAERIVVSPDGSWLVRHLTGSGSTKTYRCPGCDHEIRPGVPHVVAWPADEQEQRVADRRHWHTACWNSRAHRAPTRRR